MQYYTTQGPVELDGYVTNGNGLTILFDKKLPEQILADATRAAANGSSPLSDPRRSYTGGLAPDDYIAEAQRLAGIAKAIIHDKCDIFKLLPLTRRGGLPLRRQFVVATAENTANDGRSPQKHAMRLQLLLMAVCDDRAALMSVDPLPNTLALVCGMFEPRRTKPIFNGTVPEPAPFTGRKTRKKSIPKISVPNNEILHDPALWVEPRRLKALLAAYGLTMNTAAGLVGTSSQTLSCYIKSGAKSKQTYNNVYELVRYLLKNPPAIPAQDDVQAFAWFHGLDPEQLPTDKLAILDMSLDPKRYGLTPVHTLVTDPNELLWLIELHRTTMTALTKTTRIGYSLLYQCKKGQKLTLDYWASLRLSYILKQHAEPPRPAAKHTPVTEPNNPVISPSELAEVRKAYGLSFTKLGIIANVDINVVRNYESGQRVPSKSTLAKISNAVARIRRESPLMDEIIQRPERALIAKKAYPDKYVEIRQAHHINPAVERAILDQNYDTMSQSVRVKVARWLNDLEKLDRMSLQERIAMELNAKPDDTISMENAAELLYRRKYNAIAKALNRDPDDDRLSDACTWYAAEGKKWRKAIKKGLVQHQDFVRWILSITSAKTVSELLEADNGQLMELLFARIEQTDDDKNQKGAEQET